MNRISRILILLSFVAPLTWSCAGTPGPPLTYLAAERPEGIISTEQHKELNLEFPRGGWYFFNNNFRPAPDVRIYIDQANMEAGTRVLRNADVHLAVPFAFDILFFGYNKGTDRVTALKG